MTTVFKNKSIYLLLAVIFTAANSQNIQRLDVNGNPIISDNSHKSEYVAGELLIKFKNGELDSLQLESDVLIFEGTQLTKRAAVKNKLVDKLKIKNALRGTDQFELRRTISHLRPHHKNSLTRSGKSIPIPDLYNLMVMKVSETADIPKLCEELSALEGVEYAEPNYLIKLDDTPANDTHYASKQLSLEQSNDIDIDVARAWDFSVGSPSVKVGVIDNGIDYHNVDLGNGSFGIPGAKVRGGWDYINNDADPDYTEDTSYSHGTEVAGIIGSLRNNSQGVAGIAGGDGNGNIGVQLYAFKVGPVACTNGSLSCLNTAKIIDAIVEASVSSPGFGYGCHILNNSYGSTNYNASMHSAVAVAALNNVVFVAAKGNDGSTSPHYPSDYDNPWVIAVGATGIYDTRVGQIVTEDGYSSNYGGGIDVAAPGVRSLVYTTTVNEAAFPYAQFNGTSAATPHVAGLASLIKSSSIISLHAEDVQGIIRASADKVRPDIYTYDANGWNTNVGYGRINAGRALEIVNGYNGWALTQDFTFSGSSVGNTDPYTAVLPLINGILQTYIVKRYDVRKTISLPVHQQTYVWGRGANESNNGWSASNPNFLVGFCDVASSTPLSAQLRSYVYQIWYEDGTYVGWFPCQPSEVSFSYTILGRPPVVNINSSGYVNLTWDAFPSSALQFYEIWRNVNNWGWSLIATTTNPSYVDNQFQITRPRFATDGAQYRIRTKATNNAYSSYSNIVSTQGISYFQQKISLPLQELPKEFSLLQNYPNPFNPTTTIRYAVKEANFVSLTLYNMLGQEVAQLVNENKNPGYYSVDLNASNLSSGVYLYKLVSGNNVALKKMILTK